ncbi:DegT/DnrJ/EryC1/StrS family aminotransferase [Pontibacter toksunensis]|uniref:DegT/DnrJ/EryC1/StrS family aminotransferase n=1 Tax=Pontibacter toksunensis TaxID=1332631 RepID=A0ABW6BP64_9BACT
MEDIRMTATKAPYAKLKQELDDAFSAVMESMNLEEGPQAQRFAASLETYLQVPLVVPCASGTEALRFALSVLQLPAGAEVVVPAFGDASVVEVLLQLGLKPAFADVDAATFTLTASSVESVLSPHTAAIFASHLFGQPAPMHELVQLAQQHKKWLIEDATQALGAACEGPDDVLVKAGAIGHIGLMSFFPTKPILSSGEGGAVIMHDKELTAKLQGRNDRQHLVEFTDSRQRLGALDAAMLDVKLKYVDAFNEGKEKVARYYDAAFADTELVQTPYRASYGSHVFHQYTIKVTLDIRDGLQEYLSNNFIPSAVYYPEPLHLLANFAHPSCKAGDFPVSEELCKGVLSLPMHTELKQEQLEYICHHVLVYLTQLA